MTTSMIKPIGYLFLRWRSVVALLGGILAAIVMLFFALSGESGAQTTGPVKAIAAGDQHALAVVNSSYYGPGLVYAWGDNWYGQVGDNTIHNNRFPPTRVMDSDGEGYLTGVQAVEGGSEHSLALKSDGTMWAWGLNDDCQIGAGESPFTCPAGPIDHSYFKRPTAVLLPSGSQMKAVAAGYNHSLAIRDDGTVWAWGQGRYGQLGVNSDNPHGYPQQVHGLNNSQPPDNGLNNITEVAGGRWHSLALGANGNVYAWGDNSAFQLGTDSQTDSKYPVQVHGLNNAGTLTGVLDIAAGEVHNLALVSDGTADNVPNDGTVYAWGENAKGQLGCHSNTDHGYPVQVKGGAQGLDPSGHDAIHDIVGVAAGENHSLAVDKDGHVYAWGGGGNGQLGVNSNNDHTIPYQVHGLNNGQPSEGNGLSNISDVAAGEFFSLALKSDGTAVYAWGGNSYGQIDATLQDHHYPVQVGGLASATPPDEGTGKPEVTQMEPASGEVGVPRMTNVTATFSEKMDKSTLTKENFRLYEISAKKGAIQITNVRVTPNTEGTEVTLDHRPLRKDTEYVAVVTTGVKDLQGNAMATNEFWRFETGSQMGQ